MANYIYERNDITKAKDPLEYDIGKRSILGAGFGMSWMKFRDSVFLETAKKGTPVMLTDDVARRAIKGYRELHPAVVQMWYATDKAAMNAVQNPGERFTCCDGKILYAMSNDRRFLICRLPSGRYLWYYHPSVKPITTHWCPNGHGRLEVSEGKCYCPECDETYVASDIKRTKAELHYWGKDPRTKKWCELKTYGGAETENYVQGTARDVLMNGRLNVERAGYAVILPVHDEVVSEVKKGTRDFNEYMKLLCDAPKWADGYPIAAEGYVAERYRK
jgi:DNA polymerase